MSEAVQGGVIATSGPEYGLPPGPPLLRGPLLRGPLPRRSVFARLLITRPADDQSISEQ